MGKGKRTKDRNAAENVNVAVENKSSVGLWTKVAFIFIALILVASIALTTITSSGILLRSQDGFSSDNYEINGAMLSYMFQTQYQSFYSNYYSYLSYFTLDTSKNLRDQKFTSESSSGIQEILISSAYGDDVYTEGTWFDFFWDLTAKQAKQTLVFCEAAKATGVVLTDEDIAAIDADMETILETYTNLELYFGKGIKAKDIRAVMELSTLADKFYTAWYEEKIAEVTDDDVKNYFEENKSDYLKADYYLFNFTASLIAEDTKNPTDEELAAFNEDIAEAKAHVEALKACETVEAIEEYMIGYWLDQHYDSYHTTSVTDLKKENKVTDSDVPDKDELKEEAKAKVYLAVIEAIANETAVEDLEAMGDTAYDLVLTSTRDKLINQINTKLDSMLTKAANFNTDNKEMEWIFSADRAAGDVNVVSSEDAAKEESTEQATSFSISFYRIEKPSYIQEDVTKNFAHILITANSQMGDHTHEEGESHTKEEEEEALEKAKAEAERILAEFKNGELTKEAFDALAKDKNNDSEEYYENIKTGVMLEEIDAWIYDENRQEGDTEVVKTSSGYHVMWFMGDGEAVWFVDSKNDYTAEKIENEIDALEKTYAVTENAAIADKIG